MYSKEIRDKKRWFAKKVNNRCTVLTKNKANTSFFFIMMKKLRKHDIIGQ